MSELKFDPVERTREFFLVVRKHFAPGDLGQGIMVCADGSCPVMMAIDPEFFSSDLKRAKLTAMLMSKVAECDAAAFIHVADTWRLANKNARKFEDEPPPREANVEWLAEHGYGERVDCLMAMCQTRLGTWAISQDYRMSGETVEWVGAVSVKPITPEDGFAVFPESLGTVARA